MPRPRERVCLQDGLKLDLNDLAHRGFVQRGARSGPVGIRCISAYWDEEVASGIITADMSDEHKGSFRIQLGNFDQRIRLISRARHYGGRQWYFVCPVTNRRASVLWKPPGARQFCSREAWGPRQVAYRSQFRSVYDRGHAGKAKIKARLIGDLDPDDWDLPPKPKWMRWHTYNRLVERYDDYEEMIYPH